MGFRVNSQGNLAILENLLTSFAKEYRRYQFDPKCFALCNIQRHLGLISCLVAKIKGIFSGSVPFTVTTHSKTKVMTHASLQMDLRR